MEARAYLSPHVLSASAANDGPAGPRARPAEPWAAARPWHAIGAFTPSPSARDACAAGGGSVHSSIERTPMSIVRPAPAATKRAPGQLASSPFTLVPARRSAFGSAARVAASAGPAADASKSAARGAGTSRGAELTAPRRKLLLPSPNEESRMLEAAKAQQRAERLIHVRRRESELAHRARERYRALRASETVAAAAAEVEAQRAAHESRQAELEAQAAALRAQMGAAHREAEDLRVARARAEAEEEARRDERRAHELERFARASDAATRERKSVNARATEAAAFRAAAAQAEAARSARAVALQREREHATPDAAPREPALAASVGGRVAPGAAGAHRGGSAAADFATSRHHCAGVLRTAAAETRARAEEDAHALPAGGAAGADRRRRQWAPAPPPAARPGGSGDRRLAGASGGGGGGDAQAHGALWRSARGADLETAHGDGFGHASAVETLQLAAGTASADRPPAAADAWVEHARRVGPGGADGDVARVSLAQLETGAAPGGGARAARGAQRYAGSSPPYSAARARHDAAGGGRRSAAGGCAVTAVTAVAAVTCHSPDRALREAAEAAARTERAERGLEGLSPTRRRLDEISALLGASPGAARRAADADGSAHAPSLFGGAAARSHAAGRCAPSADAAARYAGTARTTSVSTQVGGLALLAGAEGHAPPGSAEDATALVVSAAAAADASTSPPPSPAAAPGAPGSHATRQAGGDAEVSLEAAARALGIPAAAHWGLPAALEAEGSEGSWGDAGGGHAGGGHAGDAPRARHADGALGAGRAEGGEAWHGGAAAPSGAPRAAHDGGGDVFADLFHAFGLGGAVHGAGDGGGGGGSGGGGMPADGRIALGHAMEEVHGEEQGVSASATEKHGSGWAEDEAAGGIDHASASAAPTGRRASAAPAAPAAARAAARPTEASADELFARMQAAAEEADAIMAARRGARAGARAHADGSPDRLPAQDLGEGGEPLTVGSPATSSAGSAAGGAQPWAVRSVGAHAAEREGGGGAPGGLGTGAVLAPAASVDAAAALPDAPTQAQVVGTVSTDGLRPAADAAAAGSVGAAAAAAVGARHAADARAHASEGVGAAAVAPAEAQQHEHGPRARASPARSSQRSGGASPVPLARASVGLDPRHGAELARAECLSAAIREMKSSVLGLQQIVTMMPGGARPPACTGAVRGAAPTDESGPAGARSRAVTSTDAGAERAGAGGSAGLGSARRSTLRLSRAAASSLPRAEPKPDAAASDGSAGAMRSALPTSAPAPPDTTTTGDGRVAAEDSSRAAEHAAARAREQAGGAVAPSVLAALRDRLAAGPTQSGGARTNVVAGVAVEAVSVPQRALGGEAAGRAAEVGGEGDCTKPTTADASTASAAAAEVAGGGEVAPQRAATRRAACDAHRHGNAEPPSRARARTDACTGSSDSGSGSESPASPPPVASRESSHEAPASFASRMRDTYLAEYAASVAIPPSVADALERQFARSTQGGARAGADARGGAARAEGGGAGGALRSSGAEPRATAADGDSDDDSAPRPARGGPVSAGVARALREQYVASNTHPFVRRALGDARVAANTPASVVGALGKCAAAAADEAPRVGRAAWAERAADGGADDDADDADADAGGGGGSARGDAEHGRARGSSGARAAADGSEDEHADDSDGGSAPRPARGGPVSAGVARALRERYVASNTHPFVRRALGDARVAANTPASVVGALGKCAAAAADEAWAEGAADGGADDDADVDAGGGGGSARGDAEHGRARGSSGARAAADSSEDEHADDSDGGSAPRPARGGPVSAGVARALREQYVASNTHPFVRRALGDARVAANTPASVVGALGKCAAAQQESSERASAPAATAHSSPPRHARQGVSGRGGKSDLRSSADLSGADAESADGRRGAAREQPTAPPSPSWSALAGDSGDSEGAVPSAAPSAPSLVESSAARGGLLLVPAETAGLGADAAARQQRFLERQAARRATAKASVDTRAHIVPRQRTPGWTSATAAQRAPEQHAGRSGPAGVASTGPNKRPPRGRAEPQLTRDSAGVAAAPSVRTRRQWSTVAGPRQMTTNRQRGTAS